MLRNFLLTLLSLACAHGAGKAASPPTAALADPGPTGLRVDADGVLANCYPAAGGGRHAAVLFIGGSDGGVSRLTALDAVSLQSAGITVLAISYFRGPGQPQALSEIPLETFDKALDLLAARADVDPARIGIVGFSKGAEAALLVAARRPDLKAVVAGSPSSVVWPGFDWASFRTTSTSSWTLAGQPVQPLPYGRFSMAGGMRSLFESGLRELAAHPGAVIPVERIQAPVLLVCGGADQVWPSCEMAGSVQQRVAAAQGRPVTVLAYSEADHGAFGSPAEEPRRFGFQAEPTASREARAQAWPQVLQFLRDHLQ